MNRYQHGRSNFSHNISTYIMPEDSRILKGTGERLVTETYVIGLPVASAFTCGIISPSLLSDRVRVPRTGCFPSRG